MEYQKVQSVEKVVLTKGPKLEQVVLDTMKTISAIVGATLGPGGRQVLIERQEHGLPPMVTKDGVTVYRSLGFPEAEKQAIMEASRDASVRTANEAGDGTTTATILSEAVVRLIKQFCEKNPRVSPQRVVRRLERAFKEVVEPTLRRLSVKADISTEDGRKLLRDVACISANGDTELADAVMECFRLVGDDGNVTIAEVTGPSRYEVERIEGYPIMMGYEESAGKFYPKFVNDPANQRLVMTAPAFVLYHGHIQDPQSLVELLNKIAYFWQAGEYTHNVVLVATGFSESVLGYLAMMFAETQALNVFPLRVPQTPFPNGQLDFLMDLAAVTGAEIFDPLNRPLNTARIVIEDSETGEKTSDLGQVDLYEAFRFRSNVVGKGDENALFVRVDELKTNLERAESMLDSINIQERLGRLTGGIAKLKVIGASNGETKEKRDRAEDAVCAVRGALKHGCLPGGCWGLLRLIRELSKGNAENERIIQEVLMPALFEPLCRLLENVGVVPGTWDELGIIVDGLQLHEGGAIDLDSEDHQNHNWIKYWPAVVYRAGNSEAQEFYGIVMAMLDSIEESDPKVYDALNSQLVPAFSAGILDSAPAVLEAVRNSLSIAALLGTLGGTVVFRRDRDLERAEAQATASYLRDAHSNPADERA